ncbi:mechanosensitive ion channel family protein [Candidatus Woesearchaeota archaeon]|nr:mechanosensitive ion channel family protein [Candidatus Woesearchaeota archaeon]
MVSTTPVYNFILDNVHNIRYLDNPWLGSAAIIIIFGLLAWVITTIFGLYLRVIAGKTDTVLDDILLDYLKKPIYYFVILFGVKITLMNLGINGFIKEIINSVLAISFLYIIVKLVGALIEGWGQTFAKKTESKLDDVLLPLFHKISKVIFIIIAAVWVLKIWNVNVGPYLAGLGIGGIVLGLALQDSLKNILGGISLLVDNTYSVGDKIKLESGEVGIIHEIGLRSTKVSTLNNEIIFVPNGYLANSRVLNFTQPNEKLRSKVEFGIAYGSDVEKVKKIVLQTVSKIENVCKDPEPVVQMFEMGDFALKCRVFFWVDHWDKEGLKTIEANEKVYQALVKAKVNIPFPTHTVYLKK